MQANAKDVAAGLVFIGIGLVFGITALSGMRLFSGFGVGPGFFPLALSGVLCAFGAFIALSAIGKPTVALGPVPWRGIVLVTASVLFFAFGLDTLGFAPAVAGSVLLAAASTTRTTLVGALATSLGMTAFCVGIFKYALGLNLAVLGPWLGG